MKVICDINLRDFQAWSGGKDTLDRVIQEEKADLLEDILDDMYPDGLTDTELNDLLWFDSDQVFEWCGIKTYDQIKDEIEDKREEIRVLEEDRNSDIRCDCLLYTDRQQRMKRLDEVRRDYADQIKDIMDEIEDLEAELKYAI